MKSLQVGDTKVSIINLGHLSYRLKDLERVPESEWKPRYSELFENPKLYPSQCFHIMLPDASILVDAGDYARFASLGPEYIPKDYRPPPPLIEQLSSAGIASESVAHVVITHAHYDHYSGISRKKSDGNFVLAFPNARYYLGKPDWDDEQIQKSLNDPTSGDSLTLGLVRKSGQLKLIEGDLELLQGVKIIAAPGESSGHQIMKISSSGSTLYCVGDLFHDPVEVENPTWMTTWADAVANLRSRNSLIKDSLEENAIIAAAHMPLGKLERKGGDVKFSPLLDLL